MQTIQDAFVADIVANPEDDTPRLIYADWLEDHGGEDGEARAEFIRAQCLREKYFRPTYDEAAGSDSAAARLLRRFGHDWMGNDRYDAGWGRSCVWSRGFIAEVHAPLATLQEHLPRLVQEHSIERVRATNKNPEDRMSRENVVVWWGIEHGHFDASDFVPYDVWELMPGEPNGEFPHAKDYHTVEAAHEALSRALLIMARQ